MIIIEAIKHAVIRVFDYRSRATRSEFWWFALAFIVWIILAAVVDEVVFKSGEQYSVLYNISGFFWTAIYIVGLVCLLPLMVRRLHDINMSGFWVLIFCVPLGALALLIMLVLPGTPHENRFGGTSDDDDWLLFD